MTECEYKSDCTARKALGVLSDRTEYLNHGFIDIDVAGKNIPIHLAGKIGTEALDKGLCNEYSSRCPHKKFLDELKLSE